MDLFIAVKDAHQKGKTGQTQDERDRNWRQLCLFLNEIGIIDEPYLQLFDQSWSRTLLISTFAQVMRKVSYSLERYTSLAEGTIRTAVDYVA